MAPVELIVHRSGALTTYEKPHVPIVLNNDWTKPPIGVATLSIEKGMLKATCYFHSFSNYLYQLYPSISGMSDSSKYLKVRCVSLGSTPGPDKGIKSVGDQVKETAKPVVKGPQPKIPAFQKITVKKKQP